MTAIRHCLAALALATTAACADSSGSEEASNVDSVASPNGEPSDTSSVEPPTPADVVDDVEDKVGAVEKSQRLTAVSDPNDLLGRPNGYTAATVFYDRRIEFDCTGPGVDCGATLEVWPSPEDARARADYIDSIGPPLANEYDYVKGPLLLRVSGELTPKQAKSYEAALGN